jgi:hypothetical protein
VVGGEGHNAADANVQNDADSTPAGMRAESA